jgi:capsule polysaccharide export protein KpsE/RkpR
MTYTEYSEDQADLAAENPGVSPGVKVLVFLTQMALHKRVVGAMVVASALVGTAYSLLTPVQYTATARLMTPQQSPSSLAIWNQFGNSGAASLTAAAGGALNFRNPNDVYIGLLSARPVADAVIKQFGLQSVYEAKDVTATRKMLSDRTHVVSEKSGFIVISVTDEDKKRAAEMANAYTDQLRLFTRALAVTEASQRRMFYEDQLKHAKEDLILAESSLEQFQKKTGVVEPGAQAKAAIESLAGLHAQVAAKQVELQALRSFSTSRNPSVQLAETQLESLQAQVSQLEAHANTAGSSAFGMQNVGEAGVEYLRAEHELQYRQTLFDLLIRQYDAARLDEAKDAAIIQVVEPAIPPEHRSAPHRIPIVLLFVLGGMLGSWVWLYAAENYRNNAELARSLRELHFAIKAK